MKLVEAALRQGVGSVYRAAQCVVLEEGRVVWSAVAGEADETTLFDLASLTKALSTTTLAARLLQTGVIALDDQPRPGVTLRQLLSHSSGLPAWLPLWRGLPPGDERARMVARARAEPLVATPGTQALYSDLGFILAGDWIEQRAGARLDALFGRHIGRGLTFLPPEPARCAPMQSLDYDLPAGSELRGVVHDDNCRHMGGVAGHAGLFGCALAVAEVAAALLRDHADGAARLVERRWLEALWTPSGVAGLSWCLGWDWPSGPESQAGARWPRDGVGHLGFTGCSLWMAPAEGRAVVLLSNRLDPRRENDAIRRLRPRLHDLVWQERW